MYEPPANKIRSLTAAIINAPDNQNLDTKIEITQEKGSVDCYTTNVEEALSETSKSFKKYSTLDTTHKRKTTMTASSKTHNYHFHKIPYNIYEDNIFQNNKEIKFLSMNAPSLIKETAMFGHFMYLIDGAVESYHISTLKKQLDREKLKNV